MSTDPYHAVQQEIQTSLQTAGTLRASFLRIRSTAREDSEELVWARNEVRRLLLPSSPRTCMPLRLVIARRGNGR